MRRIWGIGIVIIGIGMWYYGGTSGEVHLVNLGIAAIILGLAITALPLRGHVDREAIFLSCTPLCRFIGSLSSDLGLEGSPVVIPPYENLPMGGIFLPKFKDFDIPLGKFDEKTIFLDGSGRESGVLLAPPPGSGIVEYTIENVGNLKGSGIGYASSAVSSVLSALGLGSAEVFEKEEGTIEVFVRPLCDGPWYADPVVSAVLLGIAMGSEELIRIESLEEKNGHVRLIVRRLGGVEKWL